MIKTFEENGKKMVAVVLGDAWSNDPEDLRKSLNEVIDAAVLNQDMLENSGLHGADIFNCLKLSRALEHRTNEKGGGV